MRNILSTQLQKWTEGQSLADLFENGFMSSQATSHLNRYEKVAMFLIIVGADTASEILKHFTEEQTQKILPHIVSTDEVPKGIAMAVLDELEHGLTRPHYEGGKEYAQTILQNAFNRRSASHILERLDMADESGQIPFSRLQALDAEDLVFLLSDESIQTTALVLAYLQPRISGQVLSNLPTDRQQEISERLINAQTINPEVLFILEESLMSKFEKVNQTKKVKLNGLNVLSRVLNHAEPQVTEQILKGIGQKDQLLEQKIRDALFTFEDLPMLTDNAIQTLFQQVDRRELAYALKIASQSVQDKFFNNMSKKSAEIMKDDMENLAPIMQSEIKNKQKKIIALVRKLADEGQILIARGSDQWVE